MKSPWFGMYITNACYIGAHALCTGVRDVKTKIPCGCYCHKVEKEGVIRLEVNIPEKKEGENMPYSLKDRVAFFLERSTVGRLLVMRYEGSKGEFDRYTNRINGHVVIVPQNGEE